MKHTQLPGFLLTQSWTVCPIHLMELKSALIVLTLLQVKKKKKKPTYIIQHSFRSQLLIK